MDFLVLINKDNKVKDDVKSFDIIKTSCSTYNKEEILVNKVIEDDLINMFNAAKSKGLNLYVSSGYRSIEEQTEIYDNGKNPLAAIPGCSEHQVGLAIDIIHSEISKDDLEKNPYIFEDTKEFEWLIKNCYKYGFILRYPKGKENKTLIPYEPWHYRYVGINNAIKIQKSKKVLEEYVN